MKKYIAHIWNAGAEGRTSSAIPTHDWQFMSIGQDTVLFLKNEDGIVTHVYPYARLISITPNN